MELVNWRSGFVLVEEGVLTACLLFAVLSLPVASFFSSRVVLKGVSDLPRRYINVYPPPQEGLELSQDLGCAEVSEAMLFNGFNLDE